MKLIGNLVIIDLKNSDKEYLIVNSLNGLVDVIRHSEFLILSKWLNQKSIAPEGEAEIIFYELLCKRHHVMDDNEERELKQNVLNKLLKRHDNIVNIPKGASFIFSYDCNFSCPYCYEKDIPKSNGIFTEEMVEAVLNIYPERKPEYISFFGGEPLLLKNKSIIKHIIKKAPDAKYTATTNGYYLKDFLEIFKKVNTKQIQVTIDGSRDSHNKTRILRNGEPTYDIILEGIKLYLINKIPIKIRMNVSNDNYKECLSEKENLAKEFEYSEFLTFELQGLFQNDGNEHLSIFNELIENNNNPKMQKNRILDTLSPIANFFYKGTAIRPLINACVSVEHNRFYDSNGNIYACILSVGNQEKSIGKFFPELNYKENSILTRTTLKIDKCKNCRYSFICGGGCPNAINGQDAFKENCYNIKHELEYLIPYLYNKKYNKTSLI